METLALALLVGYAGYYFKNSKEESIRNVNNLEDSIKPDPITKYEQPVMSNIYNSNIANAANQEILNKATALYKDSENPQITGVIPPLYNQVGNETILKNLPEEDSSIAEFSKEVYRDKLVNVDPTTNQVIPVNPSLLNLPKAPIFAEHLQNDPLSVENFSAFDLNSKSKPDDKFKHDNMTPFFGGTVKQNVEKLSMPYVLDTYSGNTSTYIHKKETGPLFAQEKQNIYGTPALDYDLNRFIPSAYRQNEKPFPEERIAKPIADTIDNPVDTIIRDRQPTIDTLRVDNKQQVSYTGVNVESGQRGGIRGNIGHTQKKLPDPSFKLEPDRYIITTGSFLSQKAPENFEEMKTTVRQTQTTDYYGTVKKTADGELVRLGQGLDNSAILETYVQNTIRQQHKPDVVRNINTGIDTIVSNKETYDIKELERDTTNDNTLNLSNVIKTTVGTKSFEDIAKTTGRQTLDPFDNTRNLDSILRGLTNENDITDYIPKTTGKELIVENKYKGNIIKNYNAAYTEEKYDMKNTVRQDVKVKDYTGNVDVGTGPENRYRYKNAKIYNRKQILVSGERPAGKESSKVVSGKGVIGEFKTNANLDLKQKQALREPDSIGSNTVDITNNTTIGRVRFNRYKNKFIDRTSDANLIKDQLKDNPFNLL